MRDHAYDRVPFRLPEMEHRYGPNVHIIAQPYLLSQLASACSKGTLQPQLNRLVGALYADLLKLVLAAEFPRHTASIPTRMIDHTERGVFHGEVLDPSVRAITVSIARAGTLPSQVCFDLLNEVLDPRLVRQDHFVMARTVNAEQQVTGAAVHGVKIGGDVDEAYLLFPDPMGATGSSLSRALRTYKDEIKGTPRRILCLHLVITPEYIRRMSADHPEAVVYALRLDRGMSPPEVMDTVPGTHPDLERGLDEHQYIVPGAGGLGEVMNNAYV